MMQKIKDLINAFTNGFRLLECETCHEKKEPKDGDERFMGFKCWGCLRKGLGLEERR